MMDFTKFTSNKNILSEVVALDYNQVCSQTLSLSIYSSSFLFITFLYILNFIIIKIEKIPKTSAKPPLTF